MKSEYHAERIWNLRIESGEKFEIVAGSYSVFQEEITFSVYLKYSRFSSSWKQIATYPFPPGSSVHLRGTVVGE